MPYATARRALGVVDQHLGSGELAALGERVFEETRRSRWTGYRWTGVGVAACVLIGIALHRETAVEPDVAVLPHPVLSTFETAVGERSTVVLPDDSVVTLNTDTLVEVGFVEGSDVRRVTLQRGQAHFDVEKDTRPFEVLAAGRRIEALGTAFDVRIDTELGVLVTLLEGSVAIDEEVRLATDDSQSSVNGGYFEYRTGAPDGPPGGGAVDRTPQRTAAGHPGGR